VIGGKRVDKTLFLILTIFLGELGVHRFYAGKIGTGIIWLLTGGVFAIGWIVDIITVTTKNADTEGKIIV
jgi:TM2 domain-containing membrane protein YozV